MKRWRNTGCSKCSGHAPSWLDSCEPELELTTKSNNKTFNYFNIPSVCWTTEVCSCLRGPPRGQDWDSPQTVNSPSSRQNSHGACVVWGKKVSYQLLFIRSLPCGVMRGEKMRHEYRTRGHVSVQNSCQGGGDTCHVVWSVTCEV